MGVYTQIYITAVTVHGSLSPVQWHVNTQKSNVIYTKCHSTIKLWQRRDNSNMFLVMETARAVTVTEIVIGMMPVVDEIHGPCSQMRVQYRVKLTSGIVPKCHV